MLIALTKLLPVVWKLAQTMVVFLAGSPALSLC